MIRTLGHFGDNLTHLLETRIGRRRSIFRCLLLVVVVICRAFPGVFSRVTGTDSPFSQWGLGGFIGSSVGVAADAARLAVRPVGAGDGGIAAARALVGRCPFALLQ